MYKKDYSSNASKSSGGSTLKEKIKNIFHYLVFFILFFRMRFTKKPKNTEGILIIRFAHIGDFILWLDSAKEFRKLYPNEKITFMCYDYKNIKELAENLGYFDEVTIVNTIGIQKYKEIMRFFKMKYRIVINANPSRSDVSDFFVMAVNAVNRIAPVSDYTFMNKNYLRQSDKIYNKLIPCDGIKTMELIRNAQFIRGLGIHDFKASIPYLPIIKDKTIQLKQYFIICPGGETPLKYWETEKFSQIINYIFNDDPFIQCIIIGTNKEKLYAEAIISMIVEKERISSMIGKTSILEYIEIIRAAEYVISNDTSAVHIAAATKTKSIVIAVGWDRGRFHPYKLEDISNQNCIPIAIHADLTCMNCELIPEKMDKNCLVNNRYHCIGSIDTDKVILLYNKYLKNQRIDKILGD